MVLRGGWCNAVDHWHGTGGGSTHQRSYPTSMLKGEVRDASGASCEQAASKQSSASISLTFSDCKRSSGKSVSKSTRRPASAHRENSPAPSRHARRGAAVMAGAGGVDVDEPVPRRCEGYLQ